MIVRSKPSLLDIAFALRGSILPRVIGRMCAMTVVSIGAVVVTRLYPQLIGQLGATPFALIGLALTIFMSFRNNACFDRWWEARKLWGELIIACRSFARQTVLLPVEDRTRLLTDLIVFVKSLAARLRSQDEAGAADAPNPTDTILTRIGAGCTGLMERGLVTPIHYSVLEARLTELAHVQAGCERIKFTPLPFAYSLLLHRTAHLFCLFLPFALAPALGWWTPILAGIVGYAFFGLDALGDELEDPFGTDANDLPLDAMTRTVERELLFSLGRTDLPPALEPQGYRLT